MAKKVSNQLTSEDDALLADLGIEKPLKQASKTPREERIIAGFEAIQRFVTQHGRIPTHDDNQPIFERLYAIRLDRMRASDECKQLLASLDHAHLLQESPQYAIDPQTMDDDALLAALTDGSSSDHDLTNLVHVKSIAERQAMERKAAEEMGLRSACLDFEDFQPLFDQLQADLKTGKRQAFLLETQAAINQGDWFILNGQIAYIAHTGEKTTKHRHHDARLRIIFDNATESNMLLRSMQKALLKDASARRIVQHQQALFDEGLDEDDMASGLIYVLRSKSNHPDIQSYGASLHKIGVTGNDLKKRLANAKTDPTFLMAEVEVVATYELFNINRVQLENLLHRFFEHTRLDLAIMDRFGKPVKPREWFLVPLFIIDEVVEKIKNKDLHHYSYDPSIVQLVKCQTVNP